MSDVWIYCQQPELAAELSSPLAELGFAPRRVSANGSLVPSELEGGRPPGLLVVAAGAGEPAPDEIVRRLREHGELGEVPLVAALEREHLSGSTAAAADELLVRPFDSQEVEARVSRARQSVNGLDEAEIVRAGTLEINLATYQVSIDGATLSFAYMEYELLKFLATHPNRVFPRESLLSAVWGYDYYGGERTVDVHVRRVRAKLGNRHAWRIQTVRGVGYRFEL
jgi:DNA-binding response OmpR family regulator